MAKKSNKTEHVLRLITKNEEAAQDDVIFAIEGISENGTSAMKSLIKTDPEEISDEIESGLDQLMGIETQGKEKTIAPEIQVPEDKTPAVAEQETDETQITPEKPKPPEQTEQSEAPKPDKESEPQVQTPNREPERSGGTVTEQREELVNLAESLVREKITLVMDRMKVCACKTCINDVLALTLNSLPTKYVTTDAGKQYFQRDEYKKQYETEILAALTKACVRVKASPRHQQQ